MVSATIKPIEVECHLLDEDTDFGAILGAAVKCGYRATSSVYFDTSKNQEVWAVELNGPGNEKPILAYRGDRVLWDGQRMQVMSATEFAERVTTQ